MHQECRKLGVGCSTGSTKKEQLGKIRKAPEERLNWLRKILFSGKKKWRKIEYFHSLKNSASGKFPTTEFMCFTPKGMLLIFHLAQTPLDFCLLRT